MNYFSQILGASLVDSQGELVGTLADLGIATEEVFPTVTIIVFNDLSDTEHVVVWKEFVQDIAGHSIQLNAVKEALTFSEVRPNEVLLKRDLFDQELVDMRSMKVVRAKDLKLSQSGKTLRLMGAVVEQELGGFSKLKKGFGFNTAQNEEDVLAWNYIDFLHRNLDDVKLMKTHKTMDDLHPADIADIIEQVDEDQRAQVLSLLDDENVAEAIAELDEDDAVEILDDMDEQEASRVLSEMDPDDAAELVDELEDEKANKLLHLMGIKEQRAVRRLLEYRDETAGRIMTDEFVSLSHNACVQDALDLIRSLDDDFETINYVYLLDEIGHLVGTISLRALIISATDTPLKEISNKQIISASPHEDQEDVVLTMSKYNLLALPIVDESGVMLGIVTADDALNILEEEHEEDLQIAGATTSGADDEPNVLLDIFSREMWLLFWLIGFGIISLLFVNKLNMPSILIIASTLPVCLQSASSIVRCATSYYFDFDDEVQKPLSITSFTTSVLGSYTIVALVIWLVVWALSYAVEGYFTTHVVLQSFDKMSLLLFSETIRKSILCAILASGAGYLTSPLLLKILRKRDDDNLNTSGILLNMLILALIVIFYVIFALLIFSIF